MTYDARVAIRMSAIKQELRDTRERLSTVLGAINQLREKHNRLAMVVRVQQERPVERPLFENHRFAPTDEPGVVLACDCGAKMSRTLPDHKWGDLYASGPGTCPANTVVPLTGPGLKGDEPLSPEYVRGDHLNSERVEVVSGGQLVEARRYRQAAQDELEAMRNGTTVEHEKAERRRRQEQAIASIPTPTDEDEYQCHT